MKSKRITITYYGDVDYELAVDMVQNAVKNGIEKGELITFSNDLAVDMADNTKYPSFKVWKIKH